MTTPPHLPLDDVTIVSLAVNLPGPIAAARLSAAGARVTTVLPPSGDPLQAVAPEWFEDLHAGQQVVTADLKSAEGQARVRELLADADVLLTASRASALQRLGLDLPALAADYPRLSHVAIVGHPADEADAPGHDLTYQAQAGTVRPPQLPPTLMADLGGAERAVAEALIAVHHRDRTGAGVHREVALSQVAVDFAEPARRGLTAPGGVLGGGFAGYNVFASADGHVAVAALEPHFMTKLAQVLGVELENRKVAAVFATEPGSHWARLADEHDLPLVVVAAPDRAKG